jgi:DNA-binding beta-propeller fold protein YncE
VRLRTLIPLAAFALLLAPAATLLRPAAAQQPRGLAHATRGPVRVAFTPDSGRALVTESDTGTLAVLDAASGRILHRFETAGLQPCAVAVAGETAVVLNRLSGSVVALDLDTGQRTAFLRLLGEPTEIAVSADGRRAFVSIAQRNEVGVLALPSLALLKRIPVGRRPEALALTPDGRTLAVASFQGGDVRLIDTARLTETRRILTGAVNLRGLAVDEGGRRLWVTGQVPGSDHPTADPRTVWSNVVCSLDVRTGACVRVPLDTADRGAPDPSGVVSLPEGGAAVTLSGSDEVLVLDSHGATVERLAVGAHPRGIAARPGVPELWVAGELDSTLTVLGTVADRPVRRVELGYPEKPDLRVEGRYLFGSAALTAGGRFTCGSCHPDGRADGQTWQFVHVSDGLRRRNTRSVRGGVTLTGPFRWSGDTQDVEVFFQEEIVGLLRGPRQPHPPLHALWNLVDQFPLPPNPFRAPNGRFTAEARRGKLLFEGKAGCGGCHSGEYYGGTGRKAWVGTTPAGLPLDVPHLAGACDTPPYLHDGRAATLEMVLTRCDPGRRHGKAHRLNAGQLKDLVEFVREL